MKNPEEQQNTFKSVADLFFNYLHDVIYKPSEASLDIESLPESFVNFGKGLRYFCDAVSETRLLAKELAAGNLHSALPPSGNEIAAPLKMLHSSLMHLTWQTQQVAKGDYSQRVTFMGDFSLAFNNMIEQLEQQRKINLSEKTRLEMYMGLILMNCPNPILLFDNQGKLAYVSDSYFRYFNVFGADEILGKEIHDLLAPYVSTRSLEEIELLYDNVTFEKHLFETEQDIIFNRDESGWHFKIQIAPMLDSDRSVEGILMFFFDMTESIEARRQAEHGRMLAEQSSRAKSNFLAKMSHEIRTPMNAIIGMAELALRENVSPVVQDHVFTIKQAGSNLLSLVNDILDFSKIETGRMEIIPTEYSFSSLINNVININRIRALESHLRFVVNIDSGIPGTLYGDSIRIRQILLNLLSNAFKYTDDGFVSLSINCEDLGNDSINLRIEVADSGRGIKQEETGKLFHEFSQIDLEKNRGIEGTGLGLAITHSLVKAMNGEVSLISEYGKGSTFAVDLPQGVRGSKKLASVENKENINVLIYERREILASSIVRAIDSLGVKNTLVSKDSDFFKDLISEKYNFAFVAYSLYKDIRKKYSAFKTDAKIVLILDFGEAMKEKNMTYINLPIFSEPIANILNGTSESIANRLNKSTSVRLYAPEAKVLVVDDIAVNLKVAEGLMAPYGMQIKLCKSGQESIKAIKAKRYDMVFMDQMMPEMDGIEALAQIRKMGINDPYYKNVPVIALSANAIMGVREMLLESGFNDYLSKPIDTVMLNEIIEKWIPAHKKKIAVQKSRKAASARKRDAEKIIIEGIDTERGVAMTGGGFKNYIKVLNLFQRDGVQKIKEIKTCLSKEDIPLYSIHIHGIKSASASIGAQKLSDCAKKLEDAAKNGNLAFIHANSSAFLADMETILDNIKAAITRIEKNGPKKQMDMALLKTTLSGLKTAIETLDSAEMSRTADALHDFAQAAGGDISETITKILQNRLIGEYEDAVLLIDSILTGQT